MSKIYFKTLDCYKKHQSDSEKKKTYFKQKSNLLL